MSLEQVITTFVRQPRRRRYLELLESDRGRKKFRLRLPHFRDFDPRYILPPRPGLHTAAEIANALRALGAPPTCSVFCENESYDALDAPLMSGLEIVIGHGLAAIVSCDPTRLIYYRDEEPLGGFILSKPAA